MSLRFNIDKKYLPFIGWEPSEESHLEVRSMRYNNSEREFQLVENNTIISSKGLKTEEIGLCFQRWVRKDLHHDEEVRMFAKQPRKHVYYVVTDLKRREIELFFPASLTEKEWTERLYEEDPQLSSRGKLSWTKTCKSSLTLWKKSNEKSEQGLLRVYLHSSEQVCTDFVRYATHSQYSENEDRSTHWNIAQIVERTLKGVKKDIGMILTLDRGSAEKAKIMDHVPSIEELKNNSYLGVHTIDEDSDYRLNFYPLSDEDKNLQFMPDVDLAKASPENIATAVQERSLSYEENGEITETNYSKGRIEITKEMRVFEKGLILPAIRIQIKQVWLKTLTNCVKAFIPKSAAGVAEERLRYGRDISTDAIKKAILWPAADVSIRQTGIEELDRAEARSATVDVFISFNRAYSEAEVDQRIYKGYKTRQFLSNAINQLFGSNKIKNIPRVIQESGDGKEVSTECLSGGNDHCVSQGSNEERHSTSKADNASSRFLNHERYTQQIN
ncbi:MAG: hypothetical protein KGJ02_08045 [Verrucomicrobiota bacterium]|nr:hypothetical protein [Verrucomicrobiota bacterium]